MTLPAFTRMTERVLARLGEPARLRGEVVTPPLQVNVEHGVSVSSGYAEVVALRSVATIDSRATPVTGDLLEMLDASGAVVSAYVLEEPLDSTGYSTRFCVRAA